MKCTCVLRLRIIVDGLSIFTGIALLLVSMMDAASADSPSPVQSAPRPALTVPIPEFEGWLSRMIERGRAACAVLKNSRVSSDQRLASTYYDAQLVFTRIADYTGDPSWLTCAQAAEKEYRDRYILKYRARVPGYWIFPQGLMLDYARTGDPRSKRALKAILRRGAFVSRAPTADGTQDAKFSREVAYGILAWLGAQEIGEPYSDRLSALVQDAFSHFDQWFSDQSTPYVRPFMVALSAHALIKYYERTADPAVPRILRTAADWLWERTWRPDAEAFMYTDRPHKSGGTEPAPDLNLLIAPLYGWLYYHTGESKYLERGDAIFAGGVRRSTMGNPKQFNQNYYWSFDYVRWRSARDPASLRR